MFYDRDHNSSNSKPRFDSEGNMVDVYGGVMVPRHIIEQYGALVPGFRRQQQQRQSRSPFEGDVSCRGSRSPMGETQPQHSAASAPVSFAASAVAQNPGVHANYFSALLPQDSSLYHSSGCYSAWEEQHQAAFQNLDDSTRAQSFLPQHLTPSIRVSTTDLPGRAQHNNCLGPAQSRLAPQAAHASLCHNNNTYSPAHLSPTQKVFMHQETETMQVPPSPISAQASPDDTTMGEQQSRKRSHSMMSQTEPTTFQSEVPMPARAPSVTSQGAAEASPGDDFSPRGSRAFKRADPPVNAMGKYICTYSEECTDQMFDRKCEWSKHMDKHDRPYRCPHPSCAKLQGFTYSGGLLRHEREVHGKHGGPKAQLMCPHPTCKRHSGKGFTRKENLNEHLRRVHNSKGETSEDPTMQAMQSQSTEVAPGADDPAETPASLGGVHDPALMSSSVDVKYHHKDSLPALLEQASIEQENKRLRLENESLKTRILELEANDSFKEERLRSLENTISQLHVKYQAQAASEQLQAAEQPLENGS
ncbi:hypothetical protein AC578_9323 [Pseudocercospora eumusae]|uniref:C2H2-type domain-containing protein n=1 Tax=Pseudocercospora eumusae TaxID=321146 RepID=A0A139HNB3_9PEZI|nr:hypothetical protein AC578_9323 [Pseudocercospora eumusae]